MCLSLASTVLQLLDVGCGSGLLINALCQPAPYISDSGDPADTYIRLTELHGLDVDARELQSTLDKVKSIDSTHDCPSFLQPVLRWVDLYVFLWKGGLEAFNPNFVNLDCIVCTEV